MGTLRLDLRSQLASSRVGFDGMSHTLFFPRHDPPPESEYRPPTPPRTAWPPRATSASRRTRRRCATCARAATARCTRRASRWVEQSGSAASPCAAPLAVAHPAADDRSCASRSSPARDRRGRRRPPPPPPRRPPRATRASRSCLRSPPVRRSSSPCRRALAGAALWPSPEPQPPPPPPPRPWTPRGRRSEIFIPCRSTNTHHGQRYPQARARARRPRRRRPRRPRPRRPATATTAVPMPTAAPTTTSRAPSSLPWSR